VASSILGKENIIGCILLLNARFLSPGSVTYVKRNPIVIGEAYSPNGERIKTLQALLSKVAETSITHNLIGAQWTKLFINAMSNSIDAMTGLSQGDIVKHPSLIKIGVLILKEALQVVEKANIKLEKLPEVPVSLFKTIIKMPTPIATFVMRQLIKSKGDPDIVTSTLQSIRKGKKTEIDYLNGEFVKLGHQVGFPTPYNSTVVELIHKIEQTQEFFTPQELAERFTFNRS
jgi:2-dehydropantoate 2-reductase